MRVLLTGSSGFIGGAVERELNAFGHEVICLDRSKKVGAECVVWDFASRLPEQSLPEKVDAVVHLAAKPNFAAEFDPELFQVNTVATAQLASWAAKKAGHFVFASMAGMHANQTEINARTPLDPPNQYAVSKFIAEQQIKAAIDHYVFLRIGGVYGLNGPKHLGLNTAITRAYQERAVPELGGSGKMRRNYICVLDLAKWIRTLVEDGPAEDEKSARVIYVAGPEVLTIRQYLDGVAQILADAEAPILKEGGDGLDSVIEFEHPAFAMTRFEDYLQELWQKREAGPVAERQLQTERAR